MQVERNDSEPAGATGEIEHAVMTVLLGSEHSPWSRAELEREVGGIRGDAAEVTDAVDNLYGSGLVNVSGELVTVTRAARRMDELRP